MRKFSFLKPGIVNFGMERVNSILRVRRNAEFSKAKEYVVSSQIESSFRKDHQGRKFNFPPYSHLFLSPFSPPTRKNQDYLTSNLPISDDNSNEMKKFPREFIHHVHFNPSTLCSNLFKKYSNESRDYLS